MNDTAQCEICGLESPVSEMDVGWACCCRDNPECRPPMGPTQRVVATLDTWLLDRLEWHADQATNTCADAEVTGPVLHALVAAAKRALAVPVSADPEAPLAIADLPDWWDARRARLGKPDKSTCAAELRVALAKSREASYELVERELRELSCAVRVTLDESGCVLSPHSTGPTLLAAVEAAKKRGER